MATVTVTFELDVEFDEEKSWEEVFDALVDVGAEDIKIEGLSG